MKFNLSDSTSIEFQKSRSSRSIVVPFGAARGAEITSPNFPDAVAVGVRV